VPLPRGVGSISPPPPRGVGPGPPPADQAVVLQFTLTVRPWIETNVPGFDGTTHENI